jgi:hypothetical protein
VKERPIITTDLLESEAKRLAKEGLERYEVIIKLTKEYGSKSVSEWLELDSLLRRQK